MIRLALALALLASAASSGILGEDTRAPGLHPSQALVINRPNSNPKREYVPFSGTVIASRWVLTAGHGFVNYEKRRFFFRQGGGPRLTHASVHVPYCRSAPGGAVFRIEAVVPMTMDGRDPEGDITRDVALLRLDRPVCSEKAIAAVPVNAEERLAQGARLRHYGWYNPDDLTRREGRDKAYAVTPPLTISTVAEGRILDIRRRRSASGSPEILIYHDADTDNGGSGGAYIARFAARPAGGGGTRNLDVLVGVHLDAALNGEAANYGRAYSGELVQWVEQVVDRDALHRVRLVSQAR